MGIILNFPPKLSRDEKNILTELVNNKLNEIASDINSWSGFVDVIKMEDHKFVFVGKCDNEEVRAKMQVILDAL